MINTPFNYSGNKFKLLPQLLPLFDYSKPLFVDVFCGGGSVYTNVVDKYSKVLINDIISDLIGIHKKLINEPEKIINEVKALATCKDSQEKYSELRNSYNDDKTPEKLFALILSCTNNFLRFNSNGLMNQTWGKRGWNSSTEQKVEAFVEHISKYKDKIYFSSINFNDIPINSNSFYYLDPPYGFCSDENKKITNEQISEAGYNQIWKQKDEINLYNYIRQINQKGGTFLLSGLLYHDNKSSWIMNKLIDDGFKFEELIFDYNKVSKKGNKSSQEIIIKNF
jgi:DNA adenine methylase Dam